MINKPDKAWELYMRMENTTDSFNLLQIIANDCYRVRCTTRYRLYCVSISLHV